MEVNVKKHKIIKFSKRGALMKKFKLHFLEEEIKVVRRYTFLGFSFIPSGKKHNGTEKLIRKGKKSWFLIQKMLH